MARKVKSYRSGSLTPGSYLGWSFNVPLSEPLPQEGELVRLRSNGQEALGVIDLVSYVDNSIPRWEVSCLVIGLDPESVRKILQVLEY